ncbi:hypothetical protein B5M09_007231 [Aphanomyces astaci]|uniref:Uncharacterized protein n=2 Tax=Aphanomyces astaci TaxID=112090 RepID=A0A425D504_APHAT|nr:hypothetical protein B5M09_007231 [Aphanomyces astaci]
MVIGLVAGSQSIHEGYCIRIGECFRIADIRKIGFEGSSHSNLRARNKGERATMADDKEKAKAYKKQYYQANREKELQRNKQWREANKDKSKQYYQANRENVKAQQKQYYQANREKMKAQQKKYYQANREKQLQRMKQWREANWEKEKAQDRKRRAQKREYERLAQQGFTHTQKAPLEQSLNPATNKDKAVSSRDDETTARASRAASRHRKLQADPSHDQNTKVDASPPPPQGPDTDVTPCTVVYLDPVVFSLKVYKKSFGQQPTRVEFSLIPQEYSFLGAEQGCRSCPSQPSIVSSGKYPPTAMHEGHQGPRICALCHELMFLRHCGHLWKNQGSATTSCAPPLAVPRVVEEYVV